MLVPRIMLSLKARLSGRRRRDPFVPHICALYLFFILPNGMLIEVVKKNNVGKVKNYNELHRLLSPSLQILLIATLDT